MSTTLSNVASWVEPQVAVSVRWTTASSGPRATDRLARGEICVTTCGDVPFLPAGFGDGTASVAVATGSFAGRPTEH
jgi:hypothetical protein